jgi:hypothetical protein
MFTDVYLHRNPVAGRSCLSTRLAEGETAMAVSAERPRPWFHIQLPVRLLLLGVALAVVVGGAYVAICW